ncbi:MAG TPA: hypothetical protein VEY12_04235 [Thermoplasmata archaeon]|nr:hypothetical protein [Thermoplasmata archaeon]
MANRAKRAGPKPTIGPRPTLAPCDVCGGPTYELQCKIICHRCGYTRDCSDP